MALVGGGEWTDGCDFDVDLLDASGGDEVLVLPTGAAYEHPEQLVERATAWFAALGARVAASTVLRRPDALDADVGAESAAARFVYLAGASPMHLRSVLKDTPRVGRHRRGLAAAAPCWPARRPARWCCATRWSTRAAARSPSASACSTPGRRHPHATTRGREDKLHRTLKLAPARHGRRRHRRAHRARSVDGDGWWSRPGPGRSPSTSTGEVERPTSPALPSAQRLLTGSGLRLGDRHRVDGDLPRAASPSLSAPVASMIACTTSRPSVDLAEDASSSAGRLDALVAGDEEELAAVGVRRRSWPWPASRSRTAPRVGSSSANV